MSKQSPPAPTASAVGPCPTLIQISRTPRHWKFTQHHRTTRPPPCKHQLENVNTDDKSDKSNVSGNLNFRFGSPSLLLNRKLSKYTRQTNKKKKKKTHTVACLVVLDLEQIFRTLRFRSLIIHQFRPEYIIDSVHKSKSVMCLKIRQSQNRMSQIFQYEV